MKSKNNYSTINILVASGAESAGQLFEILSTTGYQVQVAANSTLALKVAQTNPPQLIFIDQKSLLTNLQANSKTKNIPIIFIKRSPTAKIDVNLSAGAFANGTADWISMPLYPAEVVARVTQQLRLQALRNQLAVQNAELKRETSDRQFAETNLNQREQQFRTIVENTPDQIIRIDRQLQLIYVNPSFVIETKIPAAAVIGEKIEILGLSTELTELCKQTIQRAFDTGKHKKLEIAIPTKTATKYYSWHIVPEFDSHNSIDSVLIVIRNITHRKESEIILQQQLNRTNLLKRITEEIRSPLDLQTVLDTAVQEIGAAFGVSRALIHKYALTDYVPVSAEYLVPGYISLREARIPRVNNPHMEQLLFQDAAVPSDNVFTEPLFQAPPMPAILEENQIKSMLAIRTSYQDQPNGLLSLQQCDRFRHWTKEEIELLEQIAAQLGIAIAQAELLEQEKQARAELDRRNLELQQEIVERQQREAALKLIVEGTATATGREFFRSCVQHLAQVLQVSCAVVSELKDDGKTSMRTLAFWRETNWEEDVEFCLAGTPCEQVIVGEMAYYADNLQALFPEYGMLVALNLHSYWAVPLVNSSGQILGNLAVLNSQPIRRDRTKESILQIFAARASAEIERQQIDAALQVASERLQLAIAASNLGWWDWNIVTGKTYFDSQWKAILGYTVAEIENNFESWDRLLHPEDKLHVIPLLNAHLAGYAPIYEAEVRMLNKAGKWQWILTEGKVVERDPDGKPSRMAGTHKDISERKAAQEKLRQSEAKLREAQRVARVGSWEVDLATGKTFWTEEVFRIHGLDPNLPAPTAQETQERIIYPEDLPSYLAGLNESIANKKNHKGDLRIIHTDGTLRYVEVNHEPIFDEFGNLIRMAGTVMDITDRKLAEQAALKLTQQLQEAQKITKMGNWEFDLNTGKISWSEELFGIFEREFGETPTFDELLEQIHPEDRPLWLRAVEKAIAIGTPYNVDYRVCLSSGEIRHINAKGRTLIGEQGELLGLFGTAMDITERKQAEAAMRESEQRFRAIFEYAAIGIAQVSPQGQFLQVNPGFCDIIGYDESTLRGLTFSEITYPEDLAPDLAQIRQLLAGEIQSYSLEKRFIRPDGQPIWTNLTASLVREMTGEPKYIVKIVEDISDRKALEQELALREARFNAFFLNAPLGMNIIDNEFRFVQINPQLAEIDGFSVAVHIGKFVREIMPQIAPTLEGLFQQIWDTGVPITNLEFSGGTAKEPDQIHHWSCSYFPIPEVPGCPRSIGTIVLDITDRKRAEMELLTTQNRLQYLLSSSPAILFSSIPHDNFPMTFCSENIQPILGYEAQRFLDDPNLWSSLIHPEDLPGVFTNLPNLFTTGLYVHEYRFLAAGGNYRWMYNQLRLIRNDRGEPQEIIGHVIDISDRKLAEIELASAQARLQHLLAASPAVIHSCKPEGDYAMTFCSENVVDILGYPASEFLADANFWISHVHPDDLPQVFAAMPQLMATNSHAHEYRFLDASGSYRWMYALLRLIRNSAGEPIEIVGYTVDIKDRKLVEEALRESAEREKAIAAIVQKIRQTLDIEQIFTTTTSELRRVLKCDRAVVYQFNPDWSGEFVAESVGEGWNCLRLAQMENPHWLDRSVEDQNCTAKTFDSEPIADTYLQENQGGIYNQGTSYVAVADIYQGGFPDCYVKLLEQFQAKSYIIVPIFSGSRLWGLLASYQNSTSRQWTEAEINIVVQIGIQLGVALQQAELLAQTQRQSLALQKAAIAADGANRAKSEFLANMSHELRTPLNAILGFAQLMSRDRDLNSKHQENLTIINRAGEHLLNLINDILEMSKIEAGRTVLNLGNFNLVQMLDNLHSMLRLRAQAKELELIFDLAIDLPTYIHADEAKLRQVLINILGNAIKFTQTGSVTLQVQSAPISVLPEGSPLPNSQVQLYFEVTDTGPGIAQSEIHLLFEAFGQTSSGQNSQQGTGLGLPISRKFVQLMGGDISVSSIVGQGSKFEFHIQVETVETGDIIPSSPTLKVRSLAPNQPEYRILVVDDRPESRLLLTLLLSSIGFQVREAENGKEAIDLWSSWEPHLICMDMRMPVMDGYTATKEIKTHLKGEATTIIALTASAFEEERKTILSAGCNDFIRKPFQESFLLEKIAKHLGVVYIYDQEDAVNSEPESSQTIAGEDLKQYLLQMPTDWVEQLNYAACECNDDVILELIGQIPAENANLANVLKDLANNFEFQKIMELTQSKLSMS